MTRKVDRLSAVHLSKKRPGMHLDGLGLYLQVTPSGARSWIYRYVIKGRVRDMGLGALVDVGLAEAREKATQARRLVRQGKDPIEVRNVLQASQRLADARAKTFRQATQDFIAAHRASWRNSRHAVQWQTTVESYAFPVLGDIAVGDITTTDVLNALRPIWIGDKDNPPRPETASRLRGRIEVIIDAAQVADDNRRANPARWKGHLQHKLPRRSKVQAIRHHPAMPYKSVPAFIARLRAHAGITSRAIELLILSACRSSEIRCLHWNEVDLVGRVLIVPPERTKGGREHRVPLSDRAMVILKEMDAIRQNNFVFAGLKPDTPLHEKTLRTALRTLVDTVTAHGFRSSFRDWAGEETAHPHDICEAALAHTRGKTHGAYQRGDLLKKRRLLMQEWADYCRSKRQADSSKRGRWTESRPGA